MKEAYSFFRSQGIRASYALILARSEERAKQAEIEFEWTEDDHPWDGDGDAPPFMMCCDAGACGYRSNLCGIGLSGSYAVDRPYQREIEAELALEILQQMECDGLCGVQASELNMPFHFHVLTLDDQDLHLCGPCMDRLADEGRIEWDYAREKA